MFRFENENGFFNNCLTIIGTKFLIVLTTLWSIGNLYPYSSLVNNSYPFLINIWFLSFWFKNSIVWYLGAGWYESLWRYILAPIPNGNLTISFE